MTRLLAILAVSWGFGCGGGEASPDAMIPLDAASLALTSSAIAEGGSFPEAHTCDGADLSPPLQWSDGPTAASYAVVLTDTTIGLVHWVIWDISGQATGLAESVAKLAEPTAPAGAKQTLSFDNTTRGYLGPCPPSRHQYQLALHAVDQENLAGVDLESTREQLVAALAEHTLSSATLSAGYGE